MKSIKRNPNDIVKMKVRNIEKLKKDATNNAVKILRLFPLKILRDEYGFGEKRLREFMKHYTILLNSYSEGYIDLKDINKMMIDEVNIDVNEEMKE